MLLIHSKDFPIDRYADVARGLSLEPIVLDDAQTDSDESAIVLVDRTIDSTRFDGNGSVVLVGVGGSEEAAKAFFLRVSDDASASSFETVVRAARDLLSERALNLTLKQELEQRTNELEEVNKIGMALSTERDFDTLIGKILDASRDLSRADAGSLYIIDTNGEGEKILRWKLAQNDSISVDFEEQVLPTTKKSLAGYVALTGETLVIDDAYELSDEVEYSINRSFDLATGYRTKSIVVLPMTNQKGDRIGVVQLINRRSRPSKEKLSALNVENEVIAFDERTISVLRSLAGQAAVAVENNLLYDSIERLFEGFVTASVTAIEQRDPSTSGHSFRVADLTCALATTADRAADGVFRDTRFTEEQVREIRYASLLHDFGKVGVREQVLVKEKKLYPSQLDIIRSRFEFLMKSAEAESWKLRVEWLLQHRAGDADELASFEEALRGELSRLEEEFGVVRLSNEPTVLPEGEFEHLQSLAERVYPDMSGEMRRLLEPEEIKILSIRKGTLNLEERKEIESHVTHTYSFLSKIPWTQNLGSVPHIAFAHHEKLNGKGYPQGLNAEQIPLQSKMMTVSDIYDALTANDRPYKKAIPTERALDILGFEVKDGLLDPDIVGLFVEAKIFERAGVYRRT